MSVPTEDFIFQQGEDGEISLVYKDDAGVGIDLTGYELRMDIVGPTGTRLYTFNSDGVTDPVEDIIDEATLNNGAVNGAIYIVIDRTETLSGGALFSFLDTALNYDIFLRDASGKQKRILKGTVTIESAYTLWS